MNNLRVDPRGRVSWKPATRAVKRVGTCPGGLTIAQRPNGATVDAADPAVKDIAAAAVGNIAVVTVPAGKNTAVVASPKYITVVAAAVGTAVAAVADGPCRHAYHGLFIIPASVAVTASTFPASLSLTASSPEACGQGIVVLPSSCFGSEVR